MNDRHGYAVSMSNKSVAEKLGIRPGYTVYPINAPDDYSTLIGGLPDGAEVTGGGPADAVHLFAEDRMTLESRIAESVAAVRPGGLLWVSYPKGGASDINRDSLWPTLTPYGWRPVRQISVDSRWSALRFRPEADVAGSSDRFRIK